jgi:magnesium-transporting ATPase (P-type)
MRPRANSASEDEKISPEEHPRLLELARAGLLASDAACARRTASGASRACPPRARVVVLAHKAGLTRDQEQQERPRLDVIPFESERRYMASLHKEPEGGNVVYVKGAPERVLEMCSTQRTEQGDEPVDRDAWRRREEELADSGHRVLAIAAKQLDGQESLEEDQVNDLTLLGLVGIIDPPREEAIEAVEKCRTAGIGSR